MTEKKTEYKRFLVLAEKLLSVPHSEIKAKLDAEKQAKKRKKSRTSSVFRVADERD